jgi:transposase
MLIKWRICKIFKQGMIFADIGIEFNRDPTTISKLVTRYLENGSFERAEVSGRPRVLSEEIWDSIIKYTILLIKRQQMVSCCILQSHIMELYGVEVSVDTIASRLNI